MKKLLLVALLFLSCFCYTQTISCESFKAKPKNWSLSTSIGYINVSTIKKPVSRYQSNTWTSLNINYSTSKWSFGGWAGANYWIDSKQPDLRLGFSVTRTLKKW
jgi:hypothetical protein